MTGRSASAFGLVLALLIVACGDNVSFECDPQEQSINIRVRNAAFLEYRDAGDDWETPAVSDDEGGIICVQNVYTVMLVCEDLISPGQSDASSRTRIIQHQATTSDGVVLDFGDCHAPARPLTISGEMAQPGFAFIGDNGVGSPTGPWKFEINTTPGSHDLIATDNADLFSNRARLLIRRGLDVSTGDIGGIDLTDARTTSDFTAEVANSEPDEEQGIEAHWHTAGASALVTQSNTLTTGIVPSDLLVDGDQQTITLFLRGTRTLRTASAILSIPPLPPLQLLPRLPENINFSNEENTYTVTWTELPVTAFERITLSLSEFRGSLFVFHDVRATARWVQATGELSLRTDVSSPRFEPRWLVEQPLKKFSLRATTATTDLSTSISP
jgi:hypothetical protein